MPCDFHVFICNTECSSPTTVLSTLPDEEIDLILSEIGLVSGTATREYKICESHMDRIHQLQKCRNKSLTKMKCGIPFHLCNHKIDRPEPHGDRRVTKTLMLKILSCTGVVLPIGTPICTNCRKKLVTTPSSTADVSAHVKHNVEEADVDGVQLTMDSRITPQGENDKIFQLSFGDDEQLTTMEDGNVIASQSSQGSQYSDSSMTLLSKLEKLNSFLGMSSISPIKQKRLPLGDSSEKTKQACVSKAMECLSATCETICPGDGNLLKTMVCDYIRLSNQAPSPDETSKILIEIYNLAETWTFRRQVLSILSKNNSYIDMKEFIPDLSRWRYYAAKTHASSTGCGVPVTTEKISRSKINIGQLEHFIDFITSSQVVKDLPYGMRTLKLTTGEVVQVPNLIRSLAPSSLVHQYKNYCEAEGLSYLGTSTMYKILNECSASVRKSIEGLDYYVAEGGRAFQDLEAIINDLNLSDDKTKEMKTKLLDSKRYIKTDFKVHVQKESPVADHCRNYALSSEENSFSENCSHDHQESCNNCLTVTDIIDEIMLKVDSATWENKDAILFKLENAVDSIKEWKCHSLRSRNQENARLDLISNLGENQVLIACDWAMKFLPRKYREGQTDWFAKRGINWHITVTVHKVGDEIKTLTHVHLFSSQVSQDGNVTSSVLCDVVEDLEILIPAIREIHLFSDNAGCYKNTHTLLTLRSQLGDKVQTYNFSKAQDGKGPCDRRASHIKSCIKRYINEGHNVTTAEEMKSAIDAKQNGTYRVRVVDVITDIDSVKGKIKPIPLITQL